VVRITLRDDVVCESLMSLPTGKVHPRRSSRREDERARRSDTGIARGPGLLVAAVTAAIVFAIGQHLFPVKPRHVVTPASVATQPAASDASAAAATTAPDAAAAHDAVAAAEAAAVAAAAPEKPAADEAPKPAKPSADEETTASEAERKPLDKQHQADRDLAREAWRRNRPDVSVTGNKTSILVPIRGSIKGADFKITDKRRTVVVTLPKAVSMVTLRVYNLKHPSFKRLWIDQDEANARPADGTKLRFTLSDAFDPQVEITDDFVRVTIRRPESADGPAGSAEPRAEKRKARSEKKSAAPEDDAGSASSASEKEKDAAE